MSDTTWIRAYANKYVYTGGRVQADGGLFKGSTEVSYNGHGHVHINYDAMTWAVTSNGHLIPRTTAGGNLAKNIGNNSSYVATLSYAALNKVSDRRRKRDLGCLPLRESLTLLRGTIPRKFVYNDDDNKDIQYGMYAQDLRDLLVTSGIGHIATLGIEIRDTEEKTHDLTYPEEKVWYGINYEQYIPNLIQGWQYHDEMISGYANRMQATESRQNAQESRIESLQYQLNSALARISEQDAEIARLRGMVEAA